MQTGFHQAFRRKLLQVRSCGFLDLPKFRSSEQFSTLVAELIPCFAEAVKGISGVVVTAPRNYSNKFQRDDAKYNYRRYDEDAKKDWRREDDGYYKDGRSCRLCTTGSLPCLREPTRRYSICEKPTVERRRQWGSGTSHIREPAYMVATFPDSR